MRAERRLKKNGTIEIRLPDETKAAFMERCRQDGRIASEAVRTFIDDQLTPRSAPRRFGSSVRIGFAAITGAVLGVGMAAPSIASSVEPSRSAFERLDRDHSGTLTLKEFRGR